MTTTSREYRVDRMQTHLESPVRGPGGSILATGFVAGPGIYEYVNPDGTVRRELVTRDTLFHKDSALSLGRAPLTLLHPDEDDYPEGVTPENAGSLVAGDLDGEVIEGPGGYVKIRLAARRKDAQDAALSGEAVELSPGYHAEMDWTPGAHPEFGAYDGIQTSRTYNHVALVPRARGGTEMRVRMDSADTPAAVMRHIFTLPREDEMAAKRKDAEENKDEAQHEDAPPAPSANLDMEAMEKLIDAAVKRTFDAYKKGKEDASPPPPAKEDEAEDPEKDKAKEDEAPPEKKADAAAFLAFYRERARLDALATAYGVSVEDSMDNAALAKAVVQAAKPNFRADSADHYVVASRLLDETPSSVFVRDDKHTRNDAAADDGPIYGSNGALAKSTQE